MNRRYVNESNRPTKSIIDRNYEHAHSRPRPERKSYFRFFAASYSATYTNGQSITVINDEFGSLLNRKGILGRVLTD
jgi:hypothetical protein